MSMEYIGLAKGNGKAVFLISTRKVEELAGQLQLPCPRFVLLLMQDATNRNEQLPEALGQLLDAGCVAFCAWVRTADRSTNYVACSTSGSGRLHSLLHSLHRRLGALPERGDLRILRRRRRRMRITNSTSFPTLTGV